MTLADLRARQKPLAIALGVPWLRVVEHGNDCRIVAGVDPSNARMGERERAELAGYDWEQVWRDANCTGADGSLPSLLSVRTLPSNGCVSELVFRIPAGLDVPMLKAAKAKLSAASKNGFVDVRAGGEPSTVRVLAARADPMPADAPYRFDLDPREDILPFADGVDGEPVVMDLSEVAHVLLTGTSGGGKTTAGQALLQGALAGGAEVAVIDVQKGCADFRYAEPWCMAMASELGDAAATMTALYAEVQRRRDMNARHGAGSVRHLPQRLRPPDVFVFVDEFFGLISSAERPPTRPEPNPDLEAARLEAMAAYDAKARIAYLAGRIGSEARSAGFHLVLMTQALLGRMRLPPSVADLKLNSNRVLLGKATHGERVSALRRPESAPDSGDVVPPGRAAWEPAVGEARLVQFWHATTAEYRAWLEANLEKVPDDDRLDIEPHRMDATAGAAFVVTDEWDAGGVRSMAVAPLDGTELAEARDPGCAVPVEPELEVFDDVDLPELVDDSDVEWSVVVGVDRSERDDASSASGPVGKDHAGDPDSADHFGVGDGSVRPADPVMAGDGLAVCDDDAFGLSDPSPGGTRVRAATRITGFDDGADPSREPEACRDGPGLEPGATDGDEAFGDLAGDGVHRDSVWTPAAPTPRADIDQADVPAAAPLGPMSEPLAGIRRR